MGERGAGERKKKGEAVSQTICLGAKPKKRSKLSNMPQAGLREGEGNGG